MELEKKITYDFFFLFPYVKNNTSKIYLQNYYFFLNKYK